MSESKNDRSMSPRGRMTRPSRAKETRDRNVAPPTAKPRKAVKPKKGERAMEAQLATQPVEVVREPVVIDAESTEPPDPWWTIEREKAYVWTLEGATQTWIARELGRTRQTVAAWQESEKFEQRLSEENTDKFRSSRQRRTMQTLRLTDKAHDIAFGLLDEVKKNPKDMNARFAARDWLSEFRENSRREDEIYGLDKQRVDVNVHGGVTHHHKGSVNLSFREFLTGSLKKMGVDLDTEEIAGKRADEALVEITERALMEGTFLEDLVAREKEELAQSQLLLTSGR